MGDQVRSGGQGVRPRAGHCGLPSRRAGKAHDLADPQCHRVLCGFLTVPFCADSGWREGHHSLGRPARASQPRPRCVCALLLFLCRWLPACWRPADLSRGSCARLGSYRDADILLMDDPLSAVDPGVYQSKPSLRCTRSLWRDICCFVLQVWRVTCSIAACWRRPNTSCASSSRISCRFVRD